MEKVWEELKKIDAQAEQIRSEAQTEAKEIGRLAQKETEELLVKGKKFAQQEAQMINESATSEANIDREQKLKSNQQTIESLSKRAQERMDKASTVIVNAVLEET